MAVYKNDDITLFKRAVQSVFENTLLPNAFVLVVDGQVPNPLGKIITSLESEYKLETLHLPVNVGLAKALNAGLTKVRTKWVARADADDYNDPERFALQANAIARSDNTIDIVGGAIQEIDVYGKPLAVRRTVENHSDIMRYASYRNPFNHMTVVYKTEFAIQNGGYPHIHLKEDYALWAQMLSNGARALNLPNILVFATAGKEMYSRRGGLKYATAEISLQRHLVRTGIKSLPMAIVHGISRATVFILPSFCRGWIYERFLRT